VKRCLAKDPDERWQSADDVAAELRWIAESAASPADAGPPHRKSRESVALGLAGLLAVALVAALTFGRRPAAPARPLHASILAPEGSQRIIEAALSPDGRRLALVSVESGGKPAVYVRALAEPAATRLPGTEDGQDPFWSPDGRSLGFFAHGKLQRIDVDGGRPQVICDNALRGGGAWAADDTILFGSLVGNIRRVPAKGGAPVDVTPKGQHAYPVLLPDGRRFLYFDRTKGLVVATVDGKEARTLLRVESQASIADGRLLYVDGPTHTLTARRFDPKTLALGDPTVIADGIFDDDFGSWLFSAVDGALVYGTEERRSRLTWFDRAGKELGTVGPPADYVSVDLGPSETSAMVERLDHNDDDLYLVDLARETFSRFTFGGGEFFMPVFSPDGKRVAYGAWAGHKRSVIVRPLSGVGAAEQHDVDLYPTSFTPDGAALLGEVSTGSASTKADIVLVPLTGNGAPRDVLKTAAWENDARLSPDGKWLLYHSDASGSDEVYVQDYPGGAAKWQVSSSGGWDARWRADGREILWVTPRGLASVDVAPGPSFSAGAPRLALEVRIKNYKNRCGWTMTRDGARFLVNVDPPSSPLTLVVDWAAKLPR
jgi:Tol biopolymer transport system component